MTYNEPIKAERNNYNMINPRELDVLNILWNSDHPMMATEIVNSGEGLTQSTVTAVLRKLLHAKLVEIVGVTHSGKVLSRTYRPTETSRDIILKDFTDNYSAFRNVIPKSNLFAALLKTNESAQEMQQDITDLRTMLKDYEKQYVK